VCGFDGAAHGRQASPAPQSPSTTTQAPATSQTPVRPGRRRRPLRRRRRTSARADAADTPADGPKPRPRRRAHDPAGAQAGQSPSQPPGQLGLEEVLRLANAQVSGLRQAQLNERVAEEDVRQARAAFLPKVTAPSITSTPRPRWACRGRAARAELHRQQRHQRVSGAPERRGRHRPLGPPARHARAQPRAARRGARGHGGRATRAPAGEYGSLLRARARGGAATRRRTEPHGRAGVRAHHFAAAERRRGRVR
jgi:hypothetical protein